MPHRSASYTTLSMDAARRMAANRLAIRNTHSAQMAIYHDASKRKGAYYAVPLWTIGIHGLHSGEWASIKEKIERYKESRLANPLHHLDPALQSLPADQQAEHLASFVQRIKDFIRYYVPFGGHIGAYGLGKNMSSHFDYNLLLLEADTLYIDDHGHYATGGRISTSVTEHNSLAALGLDTHEITYISRILEGKLNPGSQKPSDIEVDNYIKLILCQAFTIEAITAKLIHHLNHSSPIKLNQNDLDFLFAQAIKQHHEEIDRLSIEAITARTPRVRDTSLAPNRSEAKEVTLIASFNAALATYQATSWRHYFFGRLIGPPKTDSLTSILEDALRTQLHGLIGTESFWVCVALGWLDTAGDMGPTTRDDPNLRKIYDAVISGDNSLAL